jgi:hypothetical protein
MAGSRYTFRTAFLVALLPQFLLWLLYVLLLILADESVFHRLVLWFYSPVVSLIEQLQFASGWRTWVSFGIQVLLGPLLGAFVYPLAIGLAVHIWRTRGNNERPAA